VSDDRFDPKQRAREKQASREEDARAIAAGELRAVDVFHRNAAFAFAPDEIRIGRPKRFA